MKINVFVQCCFLKLKLILARPKVYIQTTNIFFIFRKYNFDQKIKNCHVILFFHKDESIKLPDTWKK